MRQFAKLMFFVGLGLFFGSFYVIDAYGAIRGSLQFLVKILLVSGMLIGGVAVMYAANKIGRQKQ